MEILRRESEVRRSATVKTESALRQSESWRVELEGEVALLRQSLRSVERLGRDHDEFIKTAVVRADLDAGVYFDRLKGTYPLLCLSL